MRAILRNGLKWILIAVLLVPVAFILTVVAFPIWSWIERSFAIESIGHSGPAEWCFLATYAFCGLAIAGFFWMLRRKASGLE